MANKTPVNVIRWWNIKDNSDVSLNGNYLHIINSVPTEVPYYDGFRNKFSNRNMHSDRWDTAWNARNPIHQCEPSNDVVLTKNWWIDYDAEENFFITDEICCDWERFFLYRARDQGKAWCDRRVSVWKQCDASYKAWCDHVYTTCCGTFTNIADNDGRWSYPVKECTYDKFTITEWPKWECKYKTDQAVLRIDRIWDTLQYSLYDDSGNSISANVWDYVFISDDNWPLNANAWFINQVEWVNTADYSCGWWWQWLTNLEFVVWRPDILPIQSSNPDDSVAQSWWDIFETLWWSFNTSTDDNPVCAFYEYKYVSICIYEEVWKTFAFATSEGVYTYAWDSACEPDVEWEENQWNFWDFVLIPNSQPPPTEAMDDEECSWWVVISSVFDYYGQLWYIINNNIVLNWVWSFLAQDVFSWYNYTDAVPVNNLLMFIWPDSAGALTQSTQWSQISPIFNESWSWIWYFNQWSYTNRLEDFWFVSNWGHLYTLSFSPSTIGSTGQYVFKPVLEDNDLYIRHDLWVLDRNKWDRIYLDADEEELKVYISNIWHNSSQILHFDKHLGHRYQERICNAQIRWSSCGCFYWVNGNYNYDKMWKNVEWSITQLISGIVNVSKSNEKQFNFFRLDVWYNSNIWENTVLKIKVIWDWCEETVKFRLDNFQYIKDLAAQKLIKDTDILETNWLIAKYPQKVSTKDPCYVDEMEARCSYKPRWEAPKHEDCMFEEEVDCNGIQSDTRKVKVAKYATLHFPLDLKWSIMKRELVAHSWDTFEYLSAYLEMYYTDAVTVNKYSTYVEK